MQALVQNEYFLKLARVDANAIIAYFKLPIARNLFSRNVYLRGGTRISKLNGIANQILKQLFHFGRETIDYR